MAVTKWARLPGSRTCARGFVRFKPRSTATWMTPPSIQSIEGGSARTMFDAWGQLGVERVGRRPLDHRPGPQSCASRLRPRSESHDRGDLRPHVLAAQNRLISIDRKERFH